MSKTYTHGRLFSALVALLLTLIALYEAYWKHDFSHATFDLVIVLLIAVRSKE